MVGRTRAGRDFHVAYIHTEYDASTFPHRHTKELRAACSKGYQLTNDVQKYTDLPAGKLNLCYLCFGMVGQRVDLPH
jgi:hypothetical protein